MHYWYIFRRQFVELHTSRTDNSETSEEQYTHRREDVNEFVDQ